MYQPALRQEQIKALYYLKLQIKRPMTQLIRDAVDQYLKEHGGIEQLIPKDSASERLRQRHR